MKITADKKQDEFIQTNGKLYVNFNQTEVTKTEDDITSTFWEMETLEVEDRRTAYQVVEAFKEAQKNELLNAIIVTTTSGVRFYADPVSRTDISDAILEAQEIGASDIDTITWRTPDGLKTVTVADLKEARKLGLEEKARIVGAL